MLLEGVAPCPISARPGRTRRQQVRLSCELPGDLREAAYRALPVTLSRLSVTSRTWRERLIGDGAKYCRSFR